MAATDPRSDDQPSIAALRRAVIDGLRADGYVVLDPDAARDIVHVAVSKTLLVELAAKESEPVVLVGIQSEPRGGYELLLRQPTRAELQAAVMARFQSAAERKART